MSKQKPKSQKVVIHPKSAFSFERFMGVVNRATPENIKRMTALHRRMAKKHPGDPGAVKIMQFDSFLVRRIVPSGAATSERDFYKRTAERMVGSEMWPRDVMDQFP